MNSSNASDDSPVASRQFSRRQALGYGAAGVAASTLVPTVGNRDAAAQSATPTATDDAPAITPERVSAAVGQIDSIVTDLMARTGVPGVAMAVVYRDEVVHLAGYGEREVGSGQAVDAETVFQIASMSKCLATTTVAAVVGDGNASWDAKIVDLDPTFAMYDPWVTREVTVRDLFSHRSGLAEYIGDDLGDLGYDRAEILHRIRFMPPEGRFRDHYAYNNFGFSEAAFAVAYANRVEWEDLAFERLYKPLGMTSTSSRFDDYMTMENRAVPHVPIDGVYAAKYQRQPDAESPAGGVSSSVRDLSQWLRLILGNGTIDGAELVDAASLGETFRPTNPAGRPTNPGFDQTSFYGLGWGVSVDDRGNPRFSHAGAFALGAATVVIVVPAEQFAITVLANAFPVGLVEAIAFTIYEFVQTGAVTTDYLAELAPGTAAGIAPKYGHVTDYTVPPANPAPSQSLNAYIGDFTNDYFGDCSVAIDGEKLVLHLGPAGAPYPMRHFTGHVFLYQPVGEYAGGESAVTFTVGPDGLAGKLAIENLDLNHFGTFIRT